MDKYLFDAYSTVLRALIIDYNNRSSSINLMFMLVSCGDPFIFLLSNCVFYLVEAKRASGSACLVLSYHLFQSQVQANQSGR